MFLVYIRVCVYFNVFNRCKHHIRMVCLPYFVLFIVFVTKHLLIIGKI